MAYSDFTLARLSTEFGIELRSARLFAEVLPAEPGEWLATTLVLAEQAGFSGPKARAERLISPILLELARRHNFAFAIASGRSLDVDPAHGLSGSCDFAFSFTRVQDFIQAPVFCVTVMQGPSILKTVQECAAQLVGAARLNQQQGYAIPAIYGCATTGVEWRFMKLENQALTLDTEYYCIRPIGPLLGLLLQIVETIAAYPKARQTK